MIKTGNAIFITLLTLIIGGCHNHEALTIEPISKEFNTRFLTGEGLDSHFFSTKDVMQYYQISNFNNLPSKDLLFKIDDFVKSHYQLIKMDSLDKLTLLFYKKRLFVDYSDHLYESARDNETRTLEGYSNDLSAWIEFTRLKEDRKKIMRQQEIYMNNGKQLSRSDTLILK